MSEIQFDTWRQDIIFEDRIEKDVLFIRASKRVEGGWIEYHCPVWEESLIGDAKDILELKVKDHEKKLSG